MAMWLRTSIEVQVRPGYPFHDWIEMALAGLEPNCIKKAHLILCFCYIHFLGLACSMVSLECVLSMQVSLQHPARRPQHVHPS